MIPDNSSISTTTLVDLLLHRSHGPFANSAYRFLADGKTLTRTLTFGELDQRARAIGAVLQQQGMEGERVLLLYPPGLEFISAFFGCVYAGAVAVPCPPFHSKTPTVLQSIAFDAKPRMALTLANYGSRDRKQLTNFEEFRDVQWLETDSILVELGKYWESPSLAPDSIAYLQYTSGSTASPKGVMVTHQNVLYNLDRIDQGFQYDMHSLSATWLPHFHDMGLVNGIIQPLFQGISSMMMPPLAFVQWPLRWLQMISHHKVTHTGGPNFGYDLCVQKVSTAQRAGLDLSSWAVAYNGAEPVSPDTLIQFAEYFQPSGFRHTSFYPAYGLAEGTLMVSGGRREEAPIIRTFEKRMLEQHRVAEYGEHENTEESRKLVGCGQSKGLTKILIVDPGTFSPCLPDEVGEIWVSSPSVAQGYWGRYEETQETFHAYIRGTEEGPFLRTGDLGFINGEELFVTGRLRDLVIIRGSNYYPQDIERIVEQCHPALRRGGTAAFSIQLDDKEQLVILQEMEKRTKEVDSQEVLETIRKAIGEECGLNPYGVVLVRARTLPKTSSGKIQRKRCCHEFLAGALKEIKKSLLQEQKVTTSSIGITRETLLSFGPSERCSLIENHLRQKLSEILKLPLKDGELLQQRHEFTLDSLSVVELKVDLESRWGVDLPYSSLFHSLTIEKLVPQIHGALLEHSQWEMPGNSSHLEENEESPVSPGQKGLWFLQELANDNIAYNLSVAAHVCGHVDATEIRQVFEILSDRHASLRTIFPLRDGRPLQVVLPKGTFAFEEQSIGNCDDAAVHHKIQNEINRPFNLSQGPLFRVLWLSGSSRGPILLLVAHHIILDFRSLEVLIQEVGMLLNASQSGGELVLPPLQHNYLSFNQEQAIRLSGDYQKRLEQFWERQLSGDLPVLALPTDHVRPHLQTYQGDYFSITFPGPLFDKLQDLAKRHGVTLYVLLLTVYQVFLSRITGQEEILVGSPSGGRAHVGGQNLVGYCINPLVLRSHLSGNPSFQEVLTQVQHMVWEALDHQDFPFMSLVDQLHPHRDLSTSPLFQTMFAYHKTQTRELNNLTAFIMAKDGVSLEVAGLTLQSIGVRANGAQVDLGLEVGESDQELIGCWQYNSYLFNRNTIERFSKNFETLLTNLVEHPDKGIRSVSLLTDEEHDQIIEQWNQTQRPFPHHSCVHHLFEQQVEKTPEALAVYCQGASLSYDNLNTRANQLAHFLQSLGVGPDVPVGIYLDRSVNFVVSLLGVLKAGGAYVPLDSEIPPSRVTRILREAGSSLLVVTGNEGGQFPDDIRTICLDREEEKLHQRSSRNLQSEVGPDNLAYIMFTSGSMGVPKGVQIPHRALVNYLVWSLDAYEMKQGKGAQVHSSVGFDLTVTSLLTPLLAGKTVEMGEGDFLEAIGKTPPSTEGRWSLAKLTPTHLDLVNQQQVAGKISQWTHNLIVGGEALRGEQLSLVRQYAPHTRIFNEYGPTEAVVGCCVYEVPVNGPLSGSIPIGRPIANMQMYILDGYLQPVPIGVIGELYIGGVGLARGYHNQPELTQTSFIANPFSAVPGSRLYKTGDRAKYRTDGVIEFLGRVDRQVKIRGYRVELGEIEAALAEHPEVQEVVVEAFSERIQESQGSQGDITHQELVAYIVPLPEVSEEVTKQGFRSRIREHVEQRLPHFMVPSVVMILDGLPINQNGKIDRKQLPVPAQESSQDLGKVSSPRSMTEALVKDIWEHVLKVRHVGIHDNFFQLGGHSLLATQMLIRIREVFHVSLPVRSIFESPTVATLAEKIQVYRQVDHSIYPPLIPSSESSREAPLSFAQERLWFLQEFDPGSPTYNISFGLHLSGPLHVQTVENVLTDIVRRHQVLRTCIIVREGSPLQRVLEPFPVELAPMELESMSQTEQNELAEQVMREESRRPFDLREGPLVRFTLLKREEEDHSLVVVMHHLISDGWSRDIFVREFLNLYEDQQEGREPSIPPPPAQYTDFVEWQRNWLCGDILAHQLQYWKRQLEDCPYTLKLPTDHPRPSVQSFQGKMASFSLSPSVTKGLKTLSLQHGVTVFMTLYSAFATWLFRYTGQCQVLVGTPVANRITAEMEQMMGLFMNSIVLRANLSGNPKFVEVLDRTREMMLDAFDHQDLPFEQLVKELEPDRDLSRHPLFQVMFVFQNSLGEESVSSKGLGSPLNLTMDNIPTETAKFDVTFFMEERDDGIKGAVEFNTDLFEPETMNRMVGHFQTLVNGIIQNPEMPIEQLPFITQKEYHQLVVEWNKTDQPFPEAMSIHHMFEQQVHRTPEAVAATAGQASLTFSQLNSRANQLARVLRRGGIRTGKLVGIGLNRSLELLVGVLATLKTGAAFVPLDPSNPQDRLTLMVEDAAVSCVLTGADTEETFQWGDRLQVSVNLDEFVGANEPTDNLGESLNPQSLAYIIYTSGSTGTPKGVMVPHRAVVNYLSWAGKAYQVDQGAGAIMHSSIGFDLSLTSLFAPLLAGKTVQFVSSSADIEGLRRKIEESQDLSFTKVTPSQLEVLNHGLSPNGLSGRTRFLILGGESVRNSSLAVWRSAAPNTKVINEYGPTEAVIGCCAYELPKQEAITEGVPIGRPIANTKMYILDTYLQPVPIGVSGEIYIGGACLALGYWNQTELTQAKFRENPFSYNQGEKLYRTGDWGRHTSSGNLEFLGRIDNQVKIRGYRVELGEVEQVLCSHPRVKEVAVLPWKEDCPDSGRPHEGDNQWHQSFVSRLVAYVVLHQVDTEQGRLDVTLQEIEQYCWKKLPPYMVPSRFLTLTGLPLASSGKVDRTLLPPPNQEPVALHHEVVAPRDSIESQLQEIWEHVLHRHPISMTDDFFALGGYSLLAVKLFALIEEKMGINLPLATLFRESTIEQIGNLIRDEQFSHSWTSMVEIQSQGGNLPLFCVHAGGGELLWYRDLARNLRADQPVYGLQPQGLDGKQRPHDRIEDMAAQYIREIVAIQKEGPYFLAGRCFGGLIALEVARQFKREGKEVGLLVILDSGIPNLEDDRTRKNGLMPHLLQRIVHHSRQGQLGRAVLNQFKVVKKRTQYWLNNTPELRLEAILEAQAKALNYYHLTPYSGQITLIRSSEFNHRSDKDWHLEKWQGIAQQGVDCHVISGDHMTILQEPRVGLLAEKIRECIEKVDVKFMSMK